MKRIVVTGATGFIGSALVEYLLAHTQAQIYAVVRPFSPRVSRLREHPRLTVVTLAPFELSVLQQIVNRADAFFALAWAGVRGSDRHNEKLQAENCSDMLNAAKAAAALGCNVFVGCGSQAEYGEQASPITEATKPAPTTAYGKAKLAACLEAARCAQQNGMRFVWPRIFSIYGPGDASDTLIMSSLSNMRQNSDIALGDCTQNWDYLHIEDAVRALTLLAENESAGGVYSIASGQTHPLRYFLETMLQVTGSQSKLLYGALASGGNAFGFSACVNKLAALGWKPEMAFENGIKELVDMMEGNL